MTGTEMFDAIAHIDEDLIDGCLDRIKARSSERRAHAEKAEPGDENKTSERRRTVLAFAALAAAAVLAVGLIAVLHVGGKSPTPIGPGVTDTPAPTEAGNEDGKSPFRYSVSVVLDNEESLKFKEYGPEDFPGIDCEEVENVSAALEKTIKELVENGEYHPEDEKFNKCLRIKLRDPSEENAVKAAEKIRAMEHIVSAEPFLEPYSVKIEGCLCRIEASMLNVESRIEVADRVFLYPTSFRITAENEADGKTYELQEAYEKGLITYDGLSELYRIHVGYMIRKFGYTEESYMEEVRELYPTAAPETQAPVIGNYNEHDVEKLRAFLETEADGIRNGERLNAGYSFFDPRTWTYKRWDQTVELAKWDDDGYLVEITALVEGYGLTGDLDLSGCERLDKITFSSESIAALDLTGCPLMKGVYIQNSALLKLLPDPLVTPRLSISNAGLQYIHWVAVPDEEMNKNMYDFDLTLIAKYGGSVEVWTSENLDCLDVTVAGYPAKGWHFENWYGPDGMKLENTEPFGFDWFHVPEGEEKPITGKYSFTAHFAEGEQRFAYRSGHAAYTEAVTRLMNGGGADDSLWRIHSCDVYFRLDEDAFRAYSTVEYYRVSTAGDYVFEYLDPIAEYPREVGEAALKRLYLELPAENGWDGWRLGTTAEGFAGEDWFMLKTVDDTMQDIQFACIYRKDGGEWHEFGTNKLPLNQPVFSAYVMNDKVGFVGYSGKNLDEPDGTYRKVYFYRTDDGGKTWQDMGLEIPAEYGWPYPGSVLSPVFEGDHGAMTVDATRIDLSEYTPSEELELKLWYETFDGGRTWTLHDEKDS